MDIGEQFASTFKRQPYHTTASMNEQVEGIKLNMRSWPAVLQRIERDPAIMVDRDHLAVNQRVRWELLARPGDLRKSVCETVAPPAPKDNSPGAVRS
jgi:hypothetical protein